MLTSDENKDHGVTRGHPTFNYLALPSSSTNSTAARTWQSKNCLLSEILMRSCILCFIL